MSSDEVIFVADFFYEQGIHGGAEVCNKNLIELLESKYRWKIIKLNCPSITAKFIENNLDKIFIIANFMTLDRNIMEKFSTDKRLKFIIYEHDHKYVATNDPSKFTDMMIPADKIINRNFYESAICVLAQSKLHAEIIEKNLLLDNLINLSGNIWSREQIELLSEKRKQGTFQNKDEEIYSILKSENKNKGMAKSLQICQKNNWSYRLIPSARYEDFLDELARTNKLLFTPDWVETFSRVCVEAKILDCKIITNKLVGCLSEEWVLNNSGGELLKLVSENTDRIIDLFDKILRLDFTKIEFFSTKKSTKSKISVITSIYKGKRYLLNFLNNIYQQTSFREQEFIIAHAKSIYQDEEEKEILNFIKLNNIQNVKYFKLDYLPNVQESMNFMIGKATGEIISIWNVDDNRKINSLEKISKFFDLNPKCQIVYHDCYQTTKENQTFENNSSNGELYEHSKNDYSSENMIKCLPGPMPSWRREIHQKVGFFDSRLKFAGDWDFWLRCARQGIRFHKIGPTMGLYYQNPEGLSTNSNSENRKNKFLEERQIFINNVDVFGFTNYNRYREFFNV